MSRCLAIRDILTLFFCQKKKIFEDEGRGCSCLSKKDSRGSVYIARKQCGACGNVISRALAPSSTGFWMMVKSVQKPGDLGGGAGGGGGIG
jgi:hypothetical protein